VATKTFKAKLGGDKGEVPSIVIPFDVKAEYGSARAKVAVTVNGVTLRTTVAVYGGTSFIGIRREVREQMGVEIGDTITLTIEPDAAPRVVEVPADLKRALAKNAAAKKKYASLSNSHQREHAQFVAEAKKPETRERRIARVLEMLKDG
jgi:hypothetical protein